MKVKNKSIKDILNSYTFPHRFLVRYAVFCAEKAMEYEKNTDETAIKAIDLAKRFGAGEDIPQAELDAASHSAVSAYAAYAAYSAAYSAAYYAAYSAAYSAYSAYSAASAAYAASYSAYYAASASKEECTEFLRDKLILMIKEEYSEFELILMGLV